MLRRMKGENLRKVTLSLEERLWEALKIEAVKERASMSEIVSRLVEHYLKDRERG